MPCTLNVYLTYPDAPSTRHFGAAILVRRLASLGVHVRSQAIAAGWTNTPDFTAFTDNALEDECTPHFFKVAEHLYTTRSYLLVNLQRSGGAFPFMACRFAQYAHLSGVHVSALVSPQDENHLALVRRTVRKNEGTAAIPLPVFTTPEAFLATCASRATG